MSVHPPPNGRLRLPTILPNLLGSKQAIRNKKIKERLKIMKQRTLNSLGNRRILPTIVHKFVDMENAIKRKRVNVQLRANARLRERLLQNNLTRLVRILGTVLHIRHMHPVLRNTNLLSHEQSFLNRVNNQTKQEALDFLLRSDPFYNSTYVKKVLGVQNKNNALH